MKMSSIAAWENSQKASLEAELKKIEVNKYSHISLHYAYIILHTLLLLYSNLYLLSRIRGQQTHPYPCSAGKTGEKESRIYREDKEQSRPSPQDCGRETSND